MMMPVSLPPVNRNSYFVTDESMRRSVPMEMTSSRHTFIQHTHMPQHHILQPPPAQQQQQPQPQLPSLPLSSTAESHWNEDMAEMQSMSAGKSIESMFDDIN
jgi:hypothetical protein